MVTKNRLGSDLEVGICLAILSISLIIMCSYGTALENTIRRFNLSRCVGRGKIFLANDDYSRFLKYVASAKV